MGANPTRRFTTKSYKQVTVLDQGSSDKSYKAIVTSHPPNMWVMYIYVTEQYRGKKKPFWGTDDGNIIFTGQTSVPLFSYTIIRDVYRHHWLTW